MAGGTSIGSCRRSRIVDLDMVRDSPSVARLDDGGRGHGQHGDVRRARRWRLRRGPATRAKRSCGSMAASEPSSRSSRRRRGRRRRSRSAHWPIGQIPQSRPSSSPSTRPGCRCCLLWRNSSAGRKRCSGWCRCRPVSWSSAPTRLAGVSGPKPRDWLPPCWWRRVLSCC